LFGLAISHGPKFKVHEEKIPKCTTSVQTGSMAVDLH
jgi:hypothetical protein